MKPDILYDIFHEINAGCFDGVLAPPILRWNLRLRAAAGRFIPGRRHILRASPPVIEVAYYLRTEADGARHIRDTIAHEMIHYWLWLRGLAYGHTAEFIKKMKKMGVSRYNPVPRRRPEKYVYRCPHCRTEVRVRRRLVGHACALCCKRYSGGRYAAEFRLRFEREIEPRGFLREGNV